MKEYVYILSNESMPNLVKVGSTSRSVEERIKELNSATGVPTPFVLEHYFVTSDAYTLEHLIHLDLTPYRVANNREFFEISPSDVVKHVRVHFMTDVDAEKEVMLYIKQGQWECENLTSNKWSDKGRHYQQKMLVQERDRVSKRKALEVLCKSILHEARLYPRELWSRETITVVDNIERGQLGDREQKYLSLAKEMEAQEQEAQEVAKKRAQLLADAQVGVVMDSEGREIPVSSIRHPDFYRITNDRTFQSRWNAIGNEDTGSKSSGDASTTET